MMRFDTHTLTVNAIIVAFFLLFGCIPYLGYIPIGPLRITVMHVLFLIAMEMLYLTTRVNLILAGLVYGFLFGFTSLIQAAIFPDVTSFIFLNPLFSIVPRMLMGFFTGLVAWLFKRVQFKFTSIVLAITATTLNTAFVLTFIYFIGPMIYHDTASENLFHFFTWFVLLTNYLPELIIALLLFPPISIALNRIYA